MVPEGQNKAASMPNIAAAFSSRKLIVGSPLKTSSPTLAFHIISNIPGVGLVTVSEIRLISILLILR